jgi:thiol-disulfide isomerase/thioredoxin
MKHLLTSMSLIAAVTASAQNIVCHITGTSSDPETTSVVIIESDKVMQLRGMGDMIVIPVNDGKFSYDLETDVIRYYEVIPKNQLDHGMFNMARFVAENQNLSITLGNKDFNPKVVGNGAETIKEQQCREYIDTKYGALIDALNSKQDSLIAIVNAETAGMTDDEVNNYYKQLRDTTSGNPHTKDILEIDKVFGKIIEDRYIDMLEWTTENPCFYGLNNIKMLLNNKDFYQSVTPVALMSYNTVYKELYKGHPYCEDIDMVIKSIELVRGNKYIDYEVENTDGQNVSLSSLYTGKVIYIDLWASWCGPCRKHARELIPVYEKYKDKGFQIIGIARESRIEDFNKAIDAEKYPWVNLIELADKNKIWVKNGLNNAAGSGFLIRADGTILALYPSAEDTEKILQQELGSFE